MLPTQASIKSQAMTRLQNLNNQLTLKWSRARSIRLGRYVHRGSNTCKPLMFLCFYRQPLEAEHKHRKLNTHARRLEGLPRL